MADSFGVRKGAWTGEEDDLLRKCIEKYGEAKWHQVPVRAGLNRCRKSCRLRWLNYLKPNIKRGEFAADEVDLILRLHKLLGNRWSLIAGRLPGRTANDVKNFWNTHLCKKVDKCCKNNKEMKEKAEKVEKINVIKPQPRTFAENSQWLKCRGMTSNNWQLGDYNLGKQSTPSDNHHHHHHHQQHQENETESVWWESFLFGDELDQQGISSLLSRPEEESATADIFAEKSPVVTKVKENRVIEAGQSCTTDDFAFDAELWDLLNAN